MTGAERCLWSALRKRQAGMKFRRQVCIGPYVVDFLCHEARLVLELDGPFLGSVAGQERERAREAWLAHLDYRVLRVGTEEVLDDLDSVVQRIWHACRPSPHPDLPPQAGEGAPMEGNVAHRSRDGA